MGQDGFRFVVNDGKEDSDEVTVKINVTPVNDNPVAENKTINTDINTSISFTVSGTDIDGDTISFVSYEDPEVNGTLSGNLPNLIYTPGDDFNGTDRFTYKITDGNGGTSVGTIIIGVGVEIKSPLITVWKTNAGENIRVPIIGTNYSLNWGDGTSEQDVNSHTYTSAGNYTVRISGDLQAFSMLNSPNKGNLISIEAWGNAEWENLTGAFAGAFNMKYNAKDVPDLTNVNNLNQMFQGATLFNANINNWDISNISSVAYMFDGAENFNQKITWDMGNIYNFAGMFRRAIGFNQDISLWDMSNAQNVSAMFQGDLLYNRPLWSNISPTDTHAMFKGAESFNQDISSWNMSSVVDISEMFRNATYFNQNISGWDTSSVQNMSFVFANASLFNQPLEWITDNVRTMEGMFKDAPSFNQNISNWNTSNVNNMKDMFSNTISFKGDISSWNVGAVSNMEGMFKGNISFNSDISNWNVGNVLTMKDMFSGTLSFDQDLSGWDVSKVSNFEGFLYFASGFSVANYDNLLIGWSDLNLQRDIIFDVSAESTSAAQAAKDKIISDFNWTFNEGQVPNVPNPTGP